MKAKVELTANELKKLVAEHIGAKPEDVTFVVSANYDWCGDPYGSDVKAVVTVEYQKK